MTKITIHVAIINVIIQKDEVAVAVVAVIVVQGTEVVISINGLAHEELMADQDPITITEIQHIEMNNMRIIIVAVEILVVEVSVVNQLKDYFKFLYINLMILNNRK